MGDSGTTFRNVLAWIYLFTKGQLYLGPIGSTWKAPTSINCLVDAGVNVVHSTAIIPRPRSTSIHPVGCTQSKVPRSRVDRFGTMRRARMHIMSYRIA